MIQKTNARASSTAVAPMRQASTGNSPESWGQWVGRKHYSLEVVQNPLRARMCGFGDKDRRPLAPAAVAKMVVRGDDNSIVDVDEIDCSFFLVTVDLWSSDGKHEMNLVLHPTSADRYVPTSTPKAKRRAMNPTTPSTSVNRSGRHSPGPPASAPSSSQYQQQPTGMAPFMAPSSPAYPAQVYPYPAQQAPMSDSSGFQPMSPYGPQPDPPPAWVYPPPPTSMERSSYTAPVLPPIHSIERSSSSGGAAAAGFGSAAAVTGTASGENWPLENTGREDAEPMSYRTWPQGASYSPIDNNSVSHTSGAIDPSLRVPHPSSSNPELRESSYAQMAPTPTTDTYSQSRYSQEPFTPIGQNTTVQQLENSMYASASYAQQQHQPPSQYQQGPYTQDPTPPSTIPPLPRHTYTRTLVGPLSANACRLLDEHRKPGIFFLFQDLSIRTEGLSLCKSF
ncbi:hypothetical protein AcW1_004948 [Taiwanofungus camphoratus]|nr:hypothetical protein AcW2_006041 [Antrodia cinnamomea]KAI0940147.1 hypothetical protein AcV5_001332 [Antrodia cinnamomea]KAI0941304.1 hypothetical protein AcV7_002912 [Antrodia cinnamomea]KAI0960432.1 hypothetical protein AcW1_004948 [Antrodia cinnamomea]